MVLDIVTFPAKRLREKSIEVTEFSPEIKKLIEDMKDTLLEANGYGLAAPQVGESLRIIIVDEHAGRNGREGIKAYINPMIISQDGEMIGEEGCLSLPEEFTPVKRASHITVKAMDESGEPLIINAQDHLARIFQHEIDHLDGVLFIDHIETFRRDTVKKHIKRRMKAGDYTVVDK